MPPELFLLSDWPTTGQRVELQRYQQHATRNKMHFDTTTQHNTARNSTVQYSTCNVQYMYSNEQIYNVVR